MASLYGSVRTEEGSAYLFADSETVQIFNRYCEINTPGALGREGSLHTDSTLPSQKKPLSYSKYISLLKSRRIVPNLASEETVLYLVLTLICTFFFIWRILGKDSSGN